MKRKISRSLYLSEIDEPATILQGKRVCKQYFDLVQARRENMMKDPMKTGSLIQVSDTIKSGNANEQELLKRCSWENDDVDRFCKYIFDLEVQEGCKIAGQYLKWKYIYAKTDTEIIDIISVARGTLYSNKRLAYRMVAEWANATCYINWKEEIIFEFEDDDFYDDMY